MTYSNPAFAQASAAQSAQQVMHATVGEIVSPVAAGDIVTEFTSDTTITIKAMGSDGIIRSVVLTLT